MYAAPKMMTSSERAYVAASAALGDVVAGQVAVDGATWVFGRHGRGVRFTAQDGRVVDVHVGLVEHPAGITARQLLQYLDSITNTIETAEPKAGP
jgi:hypothetical protein